MPYGNGKGHNIIDLEVLIIEKVYDEVRQFREIRETSWLRKLRVHQHAGLNSEGDWTICLIYSQSDEK